MTSTRTRSTGRRPIMAVIALAVVGLLAACSSDDTEGVATAVGGDGTTAAGSAAPSTATDPQEQMLQLTECLREQGIKISDEGLGPETLGEIDFGSKEFQDALAECEEFIPMGAEGGPGVMSEETQTQVLALAECMRKEGVDFPDPSFDSEGRIQLDPQNLDIDPTDPKVREAFLTCSKQVNLQLPGAPGN